MSGRCWQGTGLFLGSITAALVIVVAILLQGADSGDLNGFFQRRIEAQLHRRVAIGVIQLQLLSRDPTIDVRNLVIANPEWLHGGNLAEVDRLVAHVELAPVLAGRLRVRAIAVTGLRLHLLRFAPSRNNWTFSSGPGNGPAFAPLAPTQSLSITQARVDILDYGRRLFLAGPFRHAPQGARPFAFQSQGSLGGFPVSLEATGGQLNGPGVGPAWPFHAHLVDAATTVDAQGVAAQPFDLGRYDLGLAASGPNLADLGYLFDLAMPNSAPYVLRFRARSDGRHFGFTNLRGAIGTSDVTGSINSDHSAARRSLTGWFRSKTLARADIDALLSPIPSRAVARAASGAVKGAATGRWLLPDAPFGLTRLRANDFDFIVEANRTAGYALPFRNLRTRIVTSAGVLRFPLFAADVYLGRLTGRGSLDGRSAIPTLSVHARLSRAHLAAIGMAQPPNAAIDLAIDLSGSGISVHEAASRARGTASIFLTGGVLPHRAGWVLGGDLLRAIGGGSSRTTLPISCTTASLRADGDGLLSVTALGMQTPVGITRGSGSLDLGRERLDFKLQGQPADKHALQFVTPVRIAGPLLRPQVTVLPGRGARALGLRGTLGLVLTPLAGLLPSAAKQALVPVAPFADCGV